MKCSVLLITFNHSKYIHTAIESILMQIKNFDSELIVLDDCSTDNTFDIVTKKLASFPEVLCIQNEKNLGITKNYQKGFALCKGEYIFVLEGDDYWLDTLKMQKQIAFLDTHPFHSMCCHPFLIQKSDTLIFANTNNVPIDYAIPRSIAINDLILNEGLIANFSVCCYRSVFLKKIPETVFNELSYDWILNIFMAQYGLIGCLPEKMSVYREIENSSWYSKPKIELLQQTKDLIPIYDQLLEKKYSIQFKQKDEILQKNIRNLNKDITYRDFIPPFIKTLIRSLVPNILKRLK